MRNLLCSLLFLLMTCPSFGYEKPVDRENSKYEYVSIGKRKIENIYILTLGIDSIYYNNHFLSTGGITNDPVRFIQKVKSDYIENEKNEIKKLQNTELDTENQYEIVNKLKDDNYWEAQWNGYLSKAHVFTRKDSKTDIIDAFNDIAKEIKPNDIFIFYFTGFTDSDKILLDNDEIISANELFYLSENILSKRQLFFIDGSFGETFTSALQSKVMNNSQNSEITNSNKIILGYKGLAYEDGVEKGGQFTLSYALNTKANIFELFESHRGRVDFLHNLYSYAEEKKYKLNLVFFAEQDNYYTFSNHNKTRRAVVKNEDDKTGTSDKVIKKGETLCLIIGIDTFTPGFSGLRNTINDSREIKETIENKFKGEIINLENINVDDFREKIIEIQRNYEFEEGSQFLFFAASHGAKDENQIGQIVFSDSFYDKGILKNTFPITALKKITLNLGCTNSLILTDICYSGKMFDEETCNSPSVIEIPEDHLLFSKKGRQQLYDNYLKNDLQGHLFIGSSLDQEAADGAGKHSPFAQTIIDFLNNSNSDATDSSHLINDIKSNVMKNGAISTPMICAYNSDKEQARFFFIKKD